MKNLPDYFLLSAKIKNKFIPSVQTTNVASKTLYIFKNKPIVQLHANKIYTKGIQ